VTRLGPFTGVAVLLAFAAASMPLGASPAAALSAPGPGVVTTVVHGPCHRGGSIFLRVEKQPDSYLLTATAHDLPEGTRWRISLDESSNTDPDAYEGGVARAVVHHGGWTVSQTVAAVQTPYFSVTAFGPGRIDVVHGRFCSVLAQPSVPFTGVTSCHHRVQVAMVAFQRDNLTTIVRWALVGPKPDTRWMVTIDATTAGSGAGVSSRRTQDRRGILTGKDVFTGQSNPRLRMQVTADGGQRCTLGMHRVLAHPTPASAMLPKAHAAASHGGQSELRKLLGLLSAQRHARHTG
jgi:hypothetical protein